MRLVDANNLKQLIKEYMLDYKNAPTRLSVCKAFLSMLGDKNQTPTIEPETLPIVQELRKQLEQEKNKKIKIKYDDCIMTIGEICERLSNAEQQLEKVTAERDQAVEDLNTLRKRSGWKCEACYYNDHYNRDICTGCEYNNDNNWQWRGVQEENNE